MVADSSSSGEDVSTRNLFSKQSGSGALHYANVCQSLIQQSDSLKKNTEFLLKQLLVESHRATRMSTQASRSHEQLKAMDNEELKQMMVSQRQQYEQTVTDMQNAIKAKDSKIAEQNDMLNNFSDKYHKLQGGGGKKGGRRSSTTRDQSPHFVPPDNTRFKQMMASQRRHEQTLSNLENEIKTKDSKIAEQNDLLSKFGTSTERLEAENDLLNQMKLVLEETIKDKDSEISDLNEMLDNFRNLQGPPPPRGTTCAICLEAPQTHVFLPCGHVCACQQCSKRVMDRKKKCPICNQRAKKTTELFFS